MIRPSTAIGTDRHPENHGDRKPATSQVTTFSYLGHQLVKGRINIISELNFYDGLYSNGIQSNRRANYVRFLYSRIKNPVITKLLRQCCGFAKYTPQSSSYILSI